MVTRLPLRARSGRPDGGRRRPEITGGSNEISYEATLTVVGPELGGGPEAMGGGTAQSAVNHPVVQLQAVASGRIAWIEAQCLRPEHDACIPGSWPSPAMPSPASS